MNKKVSIIIFIVVSICVLAFMGIYIASVGRSFSNMNFIVLGLAAVPFVLAEVNMARFFDGKINWLKKLLYCHAALCVFVIITSFVMEVIKK